MFPVEADAQVDEPMNRVVEAQGESGVERPLRIGHPGCENRGEGAGDCFLVGEELVKSRRGDACFQSDGVGGGVMIATAAEDGGSRVEEILPTLFSAGVAFTIWIEDGHGAIFAEKIETQARTCIFRRI